jgi:uncharacterized protein (DUF58 family)
VAAPGWRHRTRVEHRRDAFSSADLERAARLLLVRSRREAASGLAGGYRSAFRGGGIEFEESRPYVPGDDVRAIDWNAFARTGTAYVKRYREERDQTVLLAVDVSRSMGFGTIGPGKAAAAAHAAALVATAAGRAGDRVGLLLFDERIREEIPPARGAAHTWRILRRLAASAHASRGGTNLLAPLERVRAMRLRRGVVVLVSDFRDDAFFERPIPAPSGRDGKRPDVPRRSGRSELVSLTSSLDFSAIIVHDPREEELPPTAALRLADPERPGRVLLLRGRSRGVRDRYRTACAVRRRALERRLRADGVDVLQLRSDRDALRALVRFFFRHVAERPRTRR